MEAYAAAGDRAESLRVYERCRRLLADELGAYPSPETEAAYRALLGGVAEPGSGSAPPAERERASLPATQRSRRPVLVALAALLLAGAGVGIALALTGGDDAVSVAPDSAAVIDATRDEVVADVPVGSRPIAIAVGREGVWVANADDGTVSHIDPATRKIVKTIGIGGDVSDVAIGFGSIWVANGNAGTVTRIDPALDAVEATIEVGGHSALAPRPVFSVATGEGGVWITSGARVLELDPATNQVVRRVTLGSVVDLTVGEGAVWVTTISERLFRLDPSTGAVTTTISVPAQASEPTAAAGSLWAIVAIGRGEVWRFDPNTGSPKGTVHTGDAPAGLAPAADALWAANRRDGTVSRVDPAGGRVEATVAVGQEPTAVAAGDGFVWVDGPAPGLAPPVTSTEERGSLRRRYARGRRRAVAAPTAVRPG